MSVSLSFHLSVGSSNCLCDPFINKAKSWPIDVSRVVQSCAELPRVTQSFDNPMDGRTDQWTDIPFYRVTRMYLKMQNTCICPSVCQPFVKTWKMNIIGYSADVCDDVCVQARAFVCACVYLRATRMHLLSTKLIFHKALASTSCVVDTLQNIQATALSH